MNLLHPLSKFVNPRRTKKNRHLQKQTEMSKTSKKPGWSNEAKKRLWNYKAGHYISIKIEW